MKLARLSLLFVFAIAMHSCSKEKENKNIMRVNFEGQEFLLDYSTKADYRNSDQGGTVTMSGIGKGTSPKSISIGLLSMESLTTKKYVYDSSNDDPIIGIAFDPIGDGSFYRGGSQGSGPFSLTFLSLSDSRVSGNFQGVVTLGNASTTITGSFDLPVE
ncbi:MAG: hypothetical protein EOO05_16845 [Chitinophagaceae bacterium]|nr:MAG: hypothetical protein EOO05_16845 [Chitinophagaceae bacterium]